MGERGNMMRDNNMMRNNMENNMMRNKMENKMMRDNMMQNEMMRDNMMRNNMQSNMMRNRMRNNMMRNNYRGTESEVGSEMDSYRDRNTYHYESSFWGMKYCSEVTTSVECRMAKDKMHQGPCAETYTTCSDSSIQDLQHVKNALESRLEDCSDVRVHFRCGMGELEQKVAQVHDSTDFDDYGYAQERVGAAQGDGNDKKKKDDKKKADDKKEDQDTKK